MRVEKGRRSPLDPSGVPVPHIMAWELTRRCNLACAHCRAAAANAPYEGELSTTECFRLVDEILQIGRPIIVLTGGEPLLREDIFDIAKYAIDKGLRVAASPNGTLVTAEAAEKMRQIGIRRISVSIDFPTAEQHDRFRGVPGAFAEAIKGIKNARQAGIEVQINTTVTRLNAPYLDELLSLAIELGAVAFHPFMLVPTGRGKEMEAEELPPEEYERTLHWIYDRQREIGERIFFKPTDVPHYWRVMRQRAKEEKAVVQDPHAGVHPHAVARAHEAGGMSAMTRGCLAGIGFFFVSHIGQVQGCGYLDVAAGNVKEKSLADIWVNSPLFRQLRNFSNLKGKCGDCEYKVICGGCRARAYEASGDYLAEEPYCIYQPGRKR
ncbi:MAG: radical SAM protein [Chloroflexi bacterium]|nr:radical SAM protein [Chloroflexota bacterium]MCL5075360.1 radical SAM protein [Chloroflexota bacterium]